MNTWTIGLLLIAACALGQAAGEVVKLPAPRTSGGLAANEAIATRHSVRDFRRDALTWAQIGQLLWAAQGITHDQDKRTAPSAGALYPLEIYAATADGLFHYIPKRHEARRVADRDVRREIRRAALDQDALDAPAVFAFAAVPSRTAQRYGDRALRYVHMEVGHAAQNLLLEAAVLGLGAVPVGAFDDVELQRALHLPVGQIPLYLVPVGQVR
jgi:SagB-type dehydrogenase family enzyme